MRKRHHHGTQANAGVVVGCGAGDDGHGFIGLSRFPFTPETCASGGVSRTGNLVYLLARSVTAHSIVEFGTSFAISTIHLAAALRDNGGVKLIGSEFESSKIAQARLNIEAAALSDLVDICGDTESGPARNHRFRIA